MQGKVQQGGPLAEPGVHPARLQRIEAYQATKYQSTETEPVLFITWDLGPDEDGRDRTLRDSFIRIPLTWDCYPALNDKSRLYNRLSAVYGARFEVDKVQWTLELPEPYNSPAGLEELPHWDARSAEGFEPVEVVSVTVDGEELIGRSAYIEVARKGEYLRIAGCNPMPKSADLPF